MLRTDDNIIIGKDLVEEKFNVFERGNLRE